MREVTTQGAFVAIAAIGLVLMVSGVHYCIYVGLFLLVLSISYLAYVHMSNRKDQQPSQSSGARQPSPVLLLISSSLQDAASRGHRTSPLEDKPPSYDTIIQLDGFPPDYYTLASEVFGEKPPPRYEECGSPPPASKSEEAAATAATNLDCHLPSTSSAESIDAGDHEHSASALAPSSDAGSSSVDGASSSEKSSTDSKKSPSSRSAAIRKFSSNLLGIAIGAMTPAPPVLPDVTQGDTNA